MERDFTDAKRTELLKYGTILFKCKVDQDLLELVVSKNDNVQLQFTRSSNEPSLGSLSINSNFDSIEFAWRGYGSGSLAQIIFATPKNRYIIYSSTTSESDRLGALHSSRFDDGLIQIDEFGKQTIRKCTDPFYSDISWASLRHVFKESEIVDLQLP